MQSKVVVAEVPQKNIAKTDKKLSYKEQKELEELPKKIEVAEIEQEKLQNLTTNPQFYQQDQNTISTTLEKLTQLTSELELLYQRWNELDKKVNVTEHK